MIIFVAEEMWGLAVDGTGTVHSVSNDPLHNHLE